MKNNYEHFGVMLDCSRDGVLNVSEIKKFASIIKKMGYNTIMLYTEDTYKVNNEPYFGYMRGGYSKEEIKELDAYLNSIGIELIPCIQTLAHFTNLAKLPHYQEIIDVNDILLIDEEKTYDLINNIFDTLEESFSSRLVNIGMDEAHMVGLGKYLDKHGFKNRPELLLKHLNRVNEIAKSHGFKTIMWSDMFFRLASKGEYYEMGIHISDEVKRLVPEDLSLAYWDYYHKNKSDYDHMISSHLEFNRNIWFAGGAWTWAGFAPLNSYSLATMTPAMESVIEHSIKDVLITMWEDDGCECSIYSVLPALLKIRMLADGINNEELIKEKFFEIVGIPYDDYILLDLPNKRYVGYDLKKNENLAKALFYQDPFMGYFDKIIEHVKIDYSSYSIQSNKYSENAEFGYLFKESSLLSKFLETKYNLGVETRKAYKNKDSNLLEKLINEVYPSSIASLKEFYKSFRNLWMKERKPFGFEIHDVRIGGLLLRLESCLQTLKDYKDSKISSIPELETELLDMNENDFIHLNVYQKLVSFSKL